MYIKAIDKWDEFSGEMDILVTDGKFNILCYYWPIHSGELKIGQKIESVGTYMAENIMTAELNEGEMAEKTDESHYSYFLIGKVINCEERLISIGELTIKLDGYLPGDIKVGDIVKLTAARMDAYI